MRRLVVSLCLALALAAVLAGVAEAGEGTPAPTDEAGAPLTPTPTEEPELTQPTPTPIDPPPFGDPAASRLLLIDGVYELVPGPGDCGWAETRRVHALYRNYETVEVVVLTSNCNPADDIYVFYPSTGELLRQRPDTPRLRLQLVDGKVTITPTDASCSGFQEFGRIVIDGREAVNLAGAPDCGGYRYYPDNSELVQISSGQVNVVTATPTRTGVTLPSTGTGAPAPLSVWIYVANGAAAAVAVLGGMLIILRRRDD